MSDIVERLRGRITKASYAQWCPIDFDLELAAEEIECLRSTLAELVALVRGECPSLLNEDSGGDAALSIAIDEVLARSRGAESK